MWSLSNVSSGYDLWFSDGAPISDPRGNSSASSRLIVDELGFLDLTAITLSGPPELDVNGWILSITQSQENETLELHEDPTIWIELSLEITPDGQFTLTQTNVEADTENGPLESSVTGRLKPLPNVLAADAAFIDDMIEQNYIPYQHIPESPGKTVEEIKALGLRLFPFSPYSFQMAMCIYDWTTASFTRMIFLKIFEYTGIPVSPFPLDHDSIAEQIWTSNWPPYMPNDTDYMNSFMMTPAESLDDVSGQLEIVSSELHQLSAVENRMISAALQSLPRVSAAERTQLFSGQVDILQLGLDHFGIEFLECPLNKGPVGQELIIPFADVLDTYVSPGTIITTKMIWAFADSIDDAIHYSNGILLVANIPSGSAVWDETAYITPLSDDPAKIEYLFAPGTQFEVQSIESAAGDGKEITVITLQPISGGGSRGKSEVDAQPEDASSGELKRDRVLDRISVYKSSTALPHSMNKIGGRKCDCVTSSGAQ